MVYTNFTLCIKINNYAKGLLLECPFLNFIIFLYIILYVILSFDYNYIKIGIYNSPLKMIYQKRKKRSSLY